MGRLPEPHLFFLFGLMSIVKFIWDVVNGFSTKVIVNPENPGRLGR
jgi:hypothetical protein